ncbi:hypothetical protein [Cytophaga aurantiaca]|uniref:hypothetical protein n=1 Tax=Cytophaga aurantiaca TaxID=29530 RepID=UPI0003A15661|nr:hypothetical protein [Cytophaga aurantiaca]
MKRLLFLILILISFTTPRTLLAQTLEGNWYTPLRNKLLHVIISTDSIVFRKCSYDSLRDYGYADRAFRIEKIVHTNYIVSSFTDSVTNYYLFGFIVDTNSGKNHMNIESTNVAFSNIAAAENAIPQFQKQPLYILFLTKQQIEKIKEGKDISTMTVNDFKIYANKIVEIDSINVDPTNKKYKLSYTYSESTSRLVLCKYGFNALVKGNKFDAMLEKFYENPETKDLLIKMAQPK